MEVSKIKLSILMEQNRPNFTKSEHKLYAYIKIHMETVMYNSLTELSEVCGVGEATILRFCRKVGFSGYQDFKLAVAQELSIVSQLSHRSEDTYMERIRVNLKQVIDDTYEVINQDALQEAIAMIKKCEDIVVYGVGHSGITAFDLQSRLLRIGKNVQVVADPHFQMMRSCTVNENTLVIAISLSGSTKDIVDAVKKAKEKNAKVVTITNYVRSPLTKISDTVLLTSGKENPLDGGSMVAKVSQLFVIDLLCTGYAVEVLEEAIRFRMETAESVAAKLY